MTSEISIPCKDARAMSETFVAGAYMYTVTIVMKKAMTPAFGEDI